MADRVAIPRTSPSSEVVVRSSAETPGPDRTFRTPGEALWCQRHALQGSIHRLQSFCDALVPLQHMVMLPEDYPKLFAAVLDFRPDIVIEVGRLYGNTTCILTEAANRLGDSTVLSLCLTDKWSRETLPRVRDLISQQWLERLDARVMDFLDLDVKEVLRGRQRVFVLIDAHGWEVAEFLLGVVWPELMGRDHLVFIHDIVSPKHYSEVRMRYFAGTASKATDIRSYHGAGLCRMGEDSEEGKFLFAHGLAGNYPEFLALVDFAERNGIALSSVEDDVRREVEAVPERRMEMQSCLGERMCSPSSAFAWMRVPGGADGLRPHLPAFSRRGDVARELARGMRSDLTRWNLGGKPSLLTYGLIAAKVLFRRYTGL